MTLDLPDFTRRISIDLPDFARLSKEILLAKYGIQSIDNSGRVIFVENFGNDITQWCKYNFGTAASIDLNTTEFSSAGFSCSIYSGSGGGALSRLVHILPVYNTSKVGIEFKFAVYITHSPIYCSLYFNTLTGTKYLEFAVDIDNNKIIVSDENWDDQDLGIFVYDQVAVCSWRSIKCVVNLDTGKVDRVQYNQTNLTDLNITMPVNGVIDYDYWWLAFQIARNGGTGGTFLLDDIIVTIDET